MRINGRNYHFELNVQSYTELTALCENNDFNNFNKLFDGGNILNIIKVACICSRGYEDRRQYEDGDYKAKYLTEEDCRFMSMTEVTKLTQEITASINADQKTTIDAEPAKKNVEDGKVEE